MRILSINASYNHSWSPDVLPSLAEMIAAPEPTVVALQECPDPGLLAEMAEKLGLAHYCAPAPQGLHTGLLWSPELEALHTGDKYPHLDEEDGGMRTWHGFASVTLHGHSWPNPITFLSCHLIPHSTRAAVPESQFLQGRLRRQGWPGVLLGDVNHGPLVGPEPDWDTVPVHNIASRTVIDPDHPDKLILDRSVGLVLYRSRLTDVAARRYEQTGDEDLLAPTGVAGGIRTDQAWTTSELVPAITGYERLDHRGVTDHHPILVNLDLERIGPVEQTPWR